MEYQIKDDKAIKTLIRIYIARRLTLEWASPSSCKNTKPNINSRSSYIKDKRNCMEKVNNGVLQETKNAKKLNLFNLVSSTLNSVNHEKLM